jgi:hypothetical protein
MSAGSQAQLSEAEEFAAGQCRDRCTGRNGEKGCVTRGGALHSFSYKDLQDTTLTLVRVRRSGLR